MIRVERNDTEIENIYTYFEFVGYDDWDQYDEIRSILTDKMHCQILDSLEGIYSKHFVLNNRGFIFKLLYHEDFGNCLCSQKKMDSDFYRHLGEIAEMVVEYL